MKVLHNIVKSPCLTEKSSRLQEADGAIAFKVDPRANKIEIGQAVEQLFDVKVAAVRTTMVRGKKKGSGLNLSDEPVTGKRLISLCRKARLIFLPSCRP